MKVTGIMTKYRRIIRILLITLAGMLPVSTILAQEEGSDRLIRIETAYGDMVFRLYGETPGHRDNMIKLIEKGYFEGQLFHRVVKDFMIQGGDPHSVGAARGQRLGTGGPGYTIPAEFRENLFHKKGALAAARTGDNVNPERASSGSQFYIVQGQVFTTDMLKMLENQRNKPFSPEAIEVYTTLGGTPHLDGSYTVFGELVKGLEVIDSIAAVATDANDRPLDDIVYHISLVE
jgi:cyclophilin family peptidyl-prolyl cis-trans isomerase